MKIGGVGVGKVCYWAGARGKSIARDLQWLSLSGSGRDKSRPRGGVGPYLLFTSIIPCVREGYMLYCNNIYRVVPYSGRHTVGKGRKEMTTKPTETTTSSISNICPRYEHAIQLLGKRSTGLILDTLMGG